MELSNHTETGAYKAIITLPESIKVVLQPNTIQITEPMECSHKITSGARIDVFLEY